MHKNRRHADPNKTKTGKTRLNPLGITQLQDLLGKETRDKIKVKIVNRINILEKRTKKNIAVS